MGESNAYLFVDVVAFERLAIQPENKVGSRGVVINGYEAYIIEQWACERRASIMACSFTGNQQDKVEVSILIVPENPQDWNPVTLAYFEELVRMHMLVKETSMGRMLVTNIPSLPSHLKLVLLSGENFWKGRRNFAVNEGLRRLGGLSRTAVTANPPSDAMVASFKQMFKIDVRVRPNFAVLELTSLLQISLFYFGLLSPEYVDGLLCDFTVRAVHNWWQQFGRPRFGRGPARADKVYMTTSVAAIIGTVTGCRQRLSALNFKPPKDPFDAEAFTLTIKRFQKSEHLPKTLHLDDTTFWRLNNLTAKMADGTADILAVMKSTVKEGLSGKATRPTEDWETLSIDVLAANVRGQRARYLWHLVGCPGTREPAAAVPRYAAVTGIPVSSLVEYSDKTVASHRHHSNLMGRVMRKHPFKGPPNGTDRDAVEKATLNSMGMLGEPFLYHNSGASSTLSKYDSHVGSHSRSYSDWFMPNADRRSSDSPSKGASLQEEDVHALGIEDSESSGHAQAAHKTEEPKSIIQLNAKRWHRLMATRDDSQISSPLGFPRKPEDDTDSLRRSHSLSEIESIVFPWPSLAPLPEVLALYDEARQLRSKLSAKIETESHQCDALAGKIATQDQKLDAEHRSQALIRFQVHASVRKEHAVRRRLRELEAFMARLEYEWVSLEGKLKEVEQSVETFKTKVEALEQRYSRRTNSRRAWLPTILGF